MLSMAVTDRGRRGSVGRSPRSRRRPSAAMRARRSSIAGSVRRILSGHIPDRDLLHLPPPHVDSTTTLSTEAYCLQSTSVLPRSSPSAPTYPPGGFRLMVTSTRVAPPGAAPSRDDGLGGVGDVLQGEVDDGGGRWAPCSRRRPGRGRRGRRRRARRTRGWRRSPASTGQVGGDEGPRPRRCWSGCRRRRWRRGRATSAGKSAGSAGTRVGSRVTPIWTTLTSRPSRARTARRSGRRPSVSSATSTGMSAENAPK